MKCVQLYNWNRDEKPWITRRMRLAQHVNEACVRREPEEEVSDLRRRVDDPVWAILYQRRKKKKCIKKTYFSPNKYARCERAYLLFLYFIRGQRLYYYNDDSIDIDIIRVPLFYFNPRVAIILSYSRSWIWYNGNIRTILYSEIKYKWKTFLNFFLRGPDLHTQSSFNSQKLKNKNRNRKKTYIEFFKFSGYIIIYALYYMYT